MKQVVIESHPWGWSHAVEERFRPLVERLEDYAATSPTAYRRRVLAAAALGFAFVILLALLLVGGIAALIALMVTSGRVNGAEVKIILALGVPAFLLLRALWIRLDPPDGTVITAAEAPALFAALDRVRTACDGPSLHRVIITDDFNAAIVQHPRFGLFGGYRNYLLIGLPLLQALDVAAFEAVVAHEFGHLVNADGKTGAHVYRVRASWARLSESLSSGATGAILRRFFRWYGPWFNAYSFVLARQQEYAADRVSARVTSSATAARALVSVMVEAARYDREHWGDVLAQADRHDTPPTLPFTSAARFFSETAADRQPWLRAALANATDLSDTHPALAQRLAALGESPALPPPCSRSAAADLLPDGGMAIAGAFDAAWWQCNAEAWRIDHDRAREMADRHAALDAAAADGSIGAADRWNHAWLTERVNGGEAAEPLYAALVTHPGEPEDVGLAHLALARLQLARGDAGGIDHAEAIMALPPSWHLIVPAADVVLAHLVAYAVDDPRLSLWQDRRDAALARHAAFDHETGRVDEAMALATADLPAVIAAIAETAAHDDKVRKVWIAARPLHYGPPDLQHVLLFETPRNTPADAVSDFMDTVLGMLAPHGSAIALQMSADRRWLRKLMQSVPDSCIYARPATGLARLDPF